MSSTEPFPHVLVSQGVFSLDGIRGGIAGIIIGTVGVEDLLMRQFNKIVQYEDRRRRDRSEFLNDRSSSYEQYAHNQIQLETPPHLIEMDFEEHATKYNMPEKRDLTVGTKGSIFGQEHPIPLIESYRTYLVQKSDSSKGSKALKTQTRRDISDNRDLTSLAAPARTVSETGSPRPPSNIRPGPFESITSPVSSQRPEQKSPMVNQRHDRRAVERTIDRYRMGKPLLPTEESNYVIVSEFEVASPLQLDPIGEVSNLVFWIVFIPSLVTVLRAVFKSFAQVW